MSVYKRMKLACCFDCGRSEQDCSCMSGSVHSNMDTLQRAYPLSSVSVHDCATTLRACKLHRPTHAVTCLWCVLRVYCTMQRYRTCVSVMSSTWCDQLTIVCVAVAYVNLFTHFVYEYLLKFNSESFHFLLFIVEIHQCFFSCSSFSCDTIRFVSWVYYVWWVSGGVALWCCCTVQYCRC